MKKNKTAIYGSALISAAVAGLLGVSASADSSFGDRYGSPRVADNSALAGMSAGNLAASEAGKHDCKGQNECKGQGGCRSGDNGCQGKNSCKSKGGCNTNNPH